MLGKAELLQGKRWAIGRGWRKAMERLRTATCVLAEATLSSATTEVCAAHPRGFLLNLIMLYLLGLLLRLHITLRNICF